MVLLEAGAAAFGSIAFAKYCAPFLYNECFAPASDDELVQRPANERSPLNAPKGLSPKQDSIRLAAQLYSAHLGSVASSSNPSRAASESGASTPVSTAPTSPASHSSSYFDLKQPPLYVKDVSAALEREAKRRNSANASTSDSPRMLPRRPSFARGYSSSSTAASASGSRPSKTVSDDSSHLLAALICLLHCPDLNDFFLSGKYLDEDVEDKEHIAVIDAFATTAQHFWPTPDAPITVGRPQLDLSAFHALLRREFVSTAPTPLSCSPVSRSASPLSSSPLSSANTLVNNNATATSSASSASGATTVSHLLRSLHVALNEGEYTQDQPTYLRESFRLNGGKDDEGETFRRHVGSLRNMSLIQEDSIVRDLFEGLCCVKVQCGACDETVVSFESFLALSLPPTTRDRSLPALIKAYERPTATPTPLYCSHCRSYQHHTETRKIWSLPEILVFQLPTPSSSSSANPTSAAQSVPQRRMSSSTTRSNSTFYSAEAYPMTGLNMAKFNGEAASNAGSSSVSINLSDSDSVVSAGPDEEELYDLFAVRESLKGGKSFRAIARDGAEWSAFDPVTGAASAVYIRDVVTPQADLLFYRRRDM